MPKNPRLIYIDQPEENIPNDKQIRMQILPEEPPPETLVESAVFAAPRVIRDVIKGGYHALKSVPEYYEKAKTEVPGLVSLIANDPKSAIRQAAAGVAESGMNTFNLPHNIANYLSENLHLLSPELNRKIQMGRMPEDTEQMINQTFGEPEKPGEKLARGITSNLEEMLGIGGVANKVNPMQLSYENIAKDVLKSREKMIEEYQGPKGHYEKLLNEADKRGVGKVNVTPKDIDLEVIKQSGVPRFYESTEKFIGDNNLRNAKSSVSDLKKLVRHLNKLPEISSQQIAARNAASKAINSIENKMFRDENGLLHEDLAMRYNDIDTGYRKNVIPYTKNAAIRKYLDEDFTKEQLFDALKKGSFKRRRSEAHPQIGIRDFTNKHPYFTGGVLGGSVLAPKIYDYLTNDPANQ